MRCAICDDDYTFLKQFRARVEETLSQKGISVECSIFLTPSELLLAQIDNFDIVFLNVDTGYWDGINVARDIRRAGSNTLIIFVSDHVGFAPSGYEVGAFRFLLKKDLDDTFTPAMEAALRQLGISQERLRVRIGKEQTEIPVGSIVYAESNKRVVTFHLEHYGKNDLSCYMKLSDLEEELEGKGFLRIHKSFLVNMRYIDNINNYTVTLKEGTELQASRQNYRQLREAYASWLDEFSAAS
ncbi:LytTR family DNA-binding domain-containing protein [Ruminococcaceae bacterium OttesenSCG-928-I18]|nr:LytTR family DNA-binding domain-containing protein [Ruminococcaceae bacterium OttesenSCG-928-I18]